MSYKMKTKDLPAQKGHLAQRKPLFGQRMNDEVTPLADRLAKRMRSSAPNKRQKPVEPIVLGWKPAKVVK